jgi:hypothetical protein
MTIWLGVILGAMALAGTAFAGSSADYTGLLGYFPTPDPNDIERASADDEPSPQPSTSPELRSPAAVGRVVAPPVLRPRGGTRVWKHRDY